MGGAAFLAVAFPFLAAGSSSIAAASPLLARRFDVIAVGFPFFAVAFPFFASASPFIAVPDPDRPRAYPDIENPRTGRALARSAPPRTRTSMETANARRRT